MSCGAGEARGSRAVGQVSKPKARATGQVNALLSLETHIRHSASVVLAIPLGRKGLQTS